MCKVLAFHSGFQSLNAHRYFFFNWKTRPDWLIIHCGTISNLNVEALEGATSLLPFFYMRNILETVEKIECVVFCDCSSFSRFGVELFVPFILFHFPWVGQILNHPRDCKFPFFMCLVGVCLNQFPIPKQVAIDFGENFQNVMYKMLHYKHFLILLPKRKEYTISYPKCDFGFMISI